MPTYYCNEYLFSEIYLEEITQIPEQAEVLASLNTLKDYRDYADTSNMNAWKDSFVHQVLYALGFNIKADSENVTLLFPMGSTEKSISICYILLPGENLDNTTMGRNWAEKIIRNLREHNLQWGLLTNGEQWRIYHQYEPTPYETYLKIDLAAILADKAREAYQIFHKFMRAENFIAKDDGQCQFDVFKKELQDKIDYIEKELENALKQKEEGGQGVLSSLCMGYVEYLRQKGDPDLENEELRRKIYHCAMLYMFRLLFLYYADARRLLSEDNHQLLAEVHQALYNMVHSGNASEKSYRLWQDLEAIFVDIDQTYNGGLFNPHESEFNLFIEESKILDFYLAPAVYHLTFYHEKSGEERPISYKDMSVRHLGTLYEGLLEHRLYIAKEDTEVIVEKDRVRFIPLSHGGHLLSGQYISKDEVYFGTDLSERKATGSYYTPEFIVELIVKNLLVGRPILIKQDFIDQERKKYEVFQNAVNRNEKLSFTKLIGEDANYYVQNTILGLRVVDPAMGSGHFLVNAANAVSNFITELLNFYEVSNDIDTSTVFWRRRVVESCLYGVDINPLAVELTKLSLWILSMSEGRPLSFLNHHLKCGNSILGAELKSVGKYPGKPDTSKESQVSLFDKNTAFKEDINSVLEKYTQIYKGTSATIEDVISKKDLLDQIEHLLEPYKQVLNYHLRTVIYRDTPELDYYEFISNPRLLQIKQLSGAYFHWELRIP